MRFQPTVKILRGPIDAAPLVSVLFLLLIFVLLSSQYVFVPGVPIRLPESGTTNVMGVAGSTVAVVVDQAGVYYFQNQITSENALRAQLQREATQSPDPLTLVVLADQAVRYGDIQKLGGLALEAGIRSTVWATRPRVPGTSLQRTNP